MVVVVMDWNPNKDVQGELSRIKKYGIYKYMVARSLGISEFTLSRQLRRELDAQMKTKIFNVIEMLLECKREAQNG